jgi:four helix bundle protein
VKGGKSEKGGKNIRVNTEEKGSGNVTRAAESFEDLHIYQRARELTNHIYSVTRTTAFSRDFGLVDQIRKSAVSVMSNVAEGFERGSKIEFIQFLYIAKGSCGEMRAQLQIAHDQTYIGVSDYRKFYDLCRLISGMISNFIAYLQQTDYKGEKINRPKRLAGQKVKKV